MPTYQGMDPLPHKFLDDAIERMIEYSARHNIDARRLPLDVGRGLHVGKNHTALANNLWGDWLLIVGSDHCFEQDALVKLIEGAVDEGLQVIRPIIMGFTSYKTPPYRMVFFRRDATGMNFMSLRPGFDFDEAADMAGEIIDMPYGAAGSGFTLYHRKVFDKVPYPWFDSGTKMEFMQEFGPDIAICIEASKYGLHPAIHLGVKVEHYDYRPIHPRESINYFFQTRRLTEWELLYLGNEGINEDNIQNIRRQLDDLEKKKREGESCPASEAEEQEKMRQQYDKQIKEKAEKGGNLLAKPPFRVLTDKGEVYKMSL